MKKTESLSLEKSTQQLYKSYIVDCLKNVKKKLGRSCTYLSFVEYNDSKRIKCVFIKNKNRQVVYYKVPYSLLEITKSDIDRVEELLILKIDN